MPVPKSRRAANDKWDKENMTTLGCKVKKEDAIAFKEYATRHGKASNTLLKDYVFKCITEQLDEETLANEQKEGESN